MRTPTIEQIATLREAFDEPLDSPVFCPWPIEPVLEFVEVQLKRGKAGLAVIKQCGLGDALFGAQAHTMSNYLLFGIVRGFGKHLHLILDRVERDPEKIRPQHLQTVLARWQDRFYPVA